MFIYILQVQNIFKSVVFSLYLLLLKEHLCHVYLLLNDKSGDPTYCLLFSGVIIIALKVTECLKIFYRNTLHKCSFRNSKYRLKTTVSKYIWDLKDRSEDFSNWETLARTKSKLNLKMAALSAKTQDLKINKNN